MAPGFIPETGRFFRCSLLAAFGCSLTPSPSRISPPITPAARIAFSRSVTPSLPYFRKVMVKASKVPYVRSCWNPARVAIRETARREV
jgi:hypothetical protein